ncbi:MAG: Tetratricopeptide domain protein [Pedosphaera sp.]|nr:Tetratricopeptide domain protein [Pedosphaera sp.]
MKRYLNHFRRLWCAPILIFLAFGCLPLQAASTSEIKAFRAAKDSFSGGWWQRAEGEFVDFARKYPGSEFYAEAILLEAQARFKREEGSTKNFAAVSELLSAEAAHAGTSADQFAYWTAEAQLYGTNYTAAAEAFARLMKDYPAASSRLRLQAALGEAEARSKLTDWPGVIEALRQPTGVFQQILQAGPTNDLDLVMNGCFLLSEAELAKKDYAAAEAALQKAALLKGNWEQEWRRLYLLGRIQLASGRAEEALQRSTNLLELAAAPGRSEMQAESIAFQGDVLEQMDCLAAAVEAYEKNVAKEVAPEQRRQAMLKVVELNLRQNKTEAAAQKLEDFLSKYPGEAGADLKLLALGELRLKQYYAAGETGPKIEGAPPVDAGTNLLQQAKTNFQNLITTFTNSPLRGKAELNLGWCLLAEGNIAESRTAFSSAVDRLPFSEDQAVARFKLADIQYLEKDFAGAITNYNSIIEQYGALAPVKNGLFEPALYQVVQAGLAQTNLTAATQAMDRILEWYPTGSLIQPAMLLVGQGLNREGSPAHAREVFSKFAAVSPDSALLPEVDLAIARTYEMESNWDGAIKKYEAWLGTYTNSPALPRAEFARAWANAEAGFDTNAFLLFTNFVARFQTNELAPLAQYWVADHYWRHDDFSRAEINYQVVFKNTNWPGSGLADQALMMASRAAVARDAVREAITYYLTNLASNPNLPAELSLEAKFAYGDALTLSKDTNNLGSNFREAIQVFSRILNADPTNRFTPLAAGRMGDCYLQLAELDPAHYQYDSASNAYQTVIDSSVADVSARSQAQIGMAQCLEKTARLKPGSEQADLLGLSLDRYLDVVYGKNLREGEKFNLYWVNEAGKNAGRLAEEMNEWKQAVALYKHLLDLLPPLRSTLEKKIMKASEHIAPEKS